MDSWLDIARIRGNFAEMFLRPETTGQALNQLDYLLWWDSLGVWKCEYGDLQLAFIKL